MAVRPKRSNDRSWDFCHRWPFLFCATFRLHAKTSRDSNQACIGSEDKAFSAKETLSGWGLGWGL